MPSSFGLGVGGWREAPTMAYRTHLKPEEAWSGQILCHLIVNKLAKLRRHASRVHFAKYTLEKYTFSQTPVKEKLVSGVESNSLWIIHMLCTCTTTTTLALNAIIVTSTCLVVRAVFLRFT